LSDFAPAQSQDRSVPTSVTVAATAHRAMIEIFRRKDPSAVDRFFAEPFVQHDPTIADGLPGMKLFAAEVANSPAADITIFRTLVDGDLVLLHSKYEGLKYLPGPLIAFDLFRFKNSKIVEHWGGREPEAAPNLSGHTQVDGPTAVIDREKTEANRALVRAFREVVTVQLHLERVGEFIDDNYIQHASGFGDGIARFKSRVLDVAKPAAVPVLKLTRRKP